MKIDFKTKISEYEWQKIIDNFWLKFTAQWFEWIGWVLIVGAITYLAEKSSNIFLKLTLTISYISLFFYFQSYFYSIEFFGVLPVKNKKSKRIISIILSSIIAILVFLFFQSLISELKNG